MGSALQRFLPEMIERLSKDLNEPIKIYNWSKPNEGLHRTISKLKSLKKLPPMVIFHGASQEFFEKKVCCIGKDEHYQKL